MPCLIGINYLFKKYDYLYLTRPSTDGVRIHFRIFVLFLCSCKWKVATFFSFLFLYKIKIIYNVNELRNCDFMILLGYNAIMARTRHRFEIIKTIPSQEKWSVTCSQTRWGNSFFNFLIYWQGIKQNMVIFKVSFW